MSDNIIKILDECLELIEDQGWSVEQCLDRYPAQRAELAGLLDAAQSLQPLAAASSPRPEFQHSARTRLENLLSDPAQPVTFSRPIRHKPQIRKTILRRFSMSWLVTLITVASLALGGTGVAYASSNALPGDALYGVKTGYEDVRLQLADTEQQAELMLKYTDERADEIGQLVEKGRFDDLDEALDEYDDEVDDLIALQNRASYDDAHSEDALVLRIQQQLQTHEQLFLKLQDECQDQPQTQARLLQSQQTVQQTHQGLKWQTEDGEEGEDTDTDETPGGGAPEDAGNPEAPQGQGGTPEDGGGAGQGDAPQDGTGAGQGDAPQDGTGAGQGDAPQDGSGAGQGYGQDDTDQGHYGDPDCDGDSSTYEDGICDESEQGGGQHGHGGGNGNGGD